MLISKIKCNWLCLTVMSVIVVFLLLSIRPYEQHSKISKNLETVSNLMRSIDENYVEDVNFDELAEVALSSMVGYLDPYSAFVPEREIANFKTATTGEYGGIGAHLGNVKENKLFVSLYKNAPAHKAGILIGDEIVKINEEDVTSKSLQDISDTLKGIPGTEVKVSINRLGHKGPLSFTIKREKVIIKNVPCYSKIINNIGYIKISGFANNTANEVQLALKDLKKAGASKLILDLRYNPGGLLDEAVKTANLFIDKDLKVVETKGRNPGASKIYSTKDAPYDKDIPILVLVNDGSASASEILAGVIQDYDRGVLIGSKTFGKGSVQIVKSIIHNSQLRITNAKYYIPSGRCIQSINYSHKEEKIVKNSKESIKTEPVFTTKNGRKVKEADGITPDIEVCQEKFAPITVALSLQRYIFDYATYFRSKHNEIANPEVFTLSDQDYQEFITWLCNKDITYTLETILDKVLKQAQQENYDDSITSKISDLKSVIKLHITRDLNKFKNEIQNILERAIVERYYCYEGAVESSLKCDPDIKKACSVLCNMDEYNALLHKSPL